MWKDARSVNSLEYQELQSLFEDSQLQLKQVCQLSQGSIFKCCRLIISHEETQLQLLKSELRDFKAALHRCDVICFLS